MKHRLWSGYHSKELLALMEVAWARNELLVVCPPLLVDHSFEKYLPGGELAPPYPEQPILGVFTSGTVSGKPRLILYSKHNIESSLDGIAALFDREKVDSIFCYPQPFHTFGLLLGYVLSMRMKLSLRVHEGKYSTGTHEARMQQSGRGTITLGTPAHFHDLLRYVRERKIQPHESYSAIIGGAPVQPELWQLIKRDLKIQFPSIGYGCTEASPGITHQFPGLAPTEAGEIGRPLPGIHANNVSDGVEIQGPSLCLAVIEPHALRPEERIVFPKRLVIRDRLVVRGDGTWVFKERLDLVINRGGSKISLEHVERRINELFGVHAVAVGVPDQRLGEELAIAIVTAGATFAGDVREMIAQFVKTDIGASIPTTHIRVIEKFPLNEAAKIDRRKLSKEILSL